MFPSETANARSASCCCANPASRRNCRSSAPKWGRLAAFISEAPPSRTVWISVRASPELPEGRKSLCRWPPGTARHIAQEAYDLRLGAVRLITRSNPEALRSTDSITHFCRSRSCQKSLALSGELNHAHFKNHKFGVRRRRNTHNTRRLLRGQFATAPGASEGRSIQRDPAYPGTSRAGSSLQRQRPRAKRCH